MQFRVERGWASNDVKIWLFETRHGKFYLAKPVQLEFVEVDEAAYLPDATLCIDSNSAGKLIPEIRKQLAGLTWPADKEEYDQAKRVEKAMQAHIDSLKLVIDRTLI